MIYLSTILSKYASEYSENGTHQRYESRGFSNGQKWWECKRPLGEGI